MAIRRYRLDVLVDIDMDALILPVDLEAKITAIARATYLKEALTEALESVDGIDVRSFRLVSPFTNNA